MHGVPLTELLDFSETLLVAFDANGKLSHANQTACDTLGWDADALGDIDFFEWLGASAKQRVTEHAAVPANGEEARADFWGTWESGERCPVHLRWEIVNSRNPWVYFARAEPPKPLIAQPMRPLEANGNGQGGKVADMPLDADSFSHLMEHHMNDILALHSIDTGAYVYASPSIEKITGYAPGHMIGRQPGEFFHPDDLKSLEEALRTKQEGSQQLDRIWFRFRMKDGNYRWCESISQPVYNAKGELVLILSATRDVHEQKLAENERQQALEQYRILAQHIPRGGVVMVNEAHETVVNEGLELSNLRHLAEAYKDGPDNSLIFLKPYTDQVFQGKHVSFQYHNYGEHYQVSGEPYRDANGIVKYALFMLMNFTEAKIYEEQLQSTVDELNFQKSALDKCAMVCVTDLNGNITYVNKKYCDISKFTGEQLLGNSHRIMRDELHPKAFYSKLWDTILEGKVWHQEIRNKDRKGGHFWVDTYIIPFRNPQGKITQFISIGFDITKRKKMEDDLKGKNFELDSFVYHTSHDLRAPLTSIMGLVNLILMDDDIDRIKDCCQMIHTSVIRLDEFIKSVLSYSRNNNSKKTLKKIDFAQLVNEILNDLSYLDNYKKITVHKEMTLEREFYCDPVRLDIICKNLISNAIKYLRQDAPGGSFLNISVSADEKYAKMVFEDNGQGIAREYKHKIFNMFYRANEDSDGSGLGLYIVKQTIEKLNGTIRLESEHRQGTKITVKIPNHRVAYNLNV